MEGGGGEFFTNNTASCTLTTTAPNESEHVYNCGSPHSDQILEATRIAAVVQDVNNAIPVFKNGNEGSTTSDINEAAKICSSSAVKSTEVNRSEKTVVGAVKCASSIDLKYPVIGSPPADLMVVNTNGFNPLQHAALRGNPG